MEGNGSTEPYFNVAQDYFCDICRIILEYFGAHGRRSAHPAGTRTPPAAAERGIPRPWTGTSTWPDQPPGWGTIRR
jgi:hypothetical protein